MGKLARVGLRVVGALCAAMVGRAVGMPLAVMPMGLSDGTVVGEEERGKVGP